MEEISVQSEELKQFIDLMPKWSELFREADTQTKQMLISTLVDKIIVKDEEITIKFKIRLEDYTDNPSLECAGSHTRRQIVSSKALDSKKRYFCRELVVKMQP